MNVIPYREFSFSGVIPTSASVRGTCDKISMTQVLHSITLGLFLSSYTFMSPRRFGAPVRTPSLRFCNMTRNSNGIILGSIYGTDIWLFLDTVNVQGWYLSIVRFMHHRGKPRYYGVFVSFSDTYPILTKSPLQRGTIQYNPRPTA